jgi:hypothetical protein
MSDLKMVPSPSCHGSSWTWTSLGSRSRSARSAGRRGGRDWYFDSEGWISDTRVSIGGLGSEIIALQVYTLFKWGFIVRPIIEDEVIRLMISWRVIIQTRYVLIVGRYHNQQQLYSILSGKVRDEFFDVQMPNEQLKMCLL